MQCECYYGANSHLEVYQICTKSLGSRMYNMVEINKNVHLTWEMPMNMVCAPKNEDKSKWLIIDKDTLDVNCGTG